MGKSLAEYGASIQLRPEMIAYKAEVEKKVALAESEIKKAFNEIITDYDFPFLLGSSSFTTVIDTTLYTLKGAKSDCRDIILITKDGVPIDEARMVDFKRKYTDASPPSSATVWVDKSRDGRYPTVGIHGTPSAVITLEYEYRKSNITIDSFPEEWDFVLEDIALGRIFKKLKSIGRKSLKKMVNNYTRRGGEESPVVMDSKWTARNKKRNTLHGY